MARKGKGKNSVMGTQKHFMEWLQVFKNGDRTTLSLAAFKVKK